MRGSRLGAIRARVERLAATCQVDEPGTRFVVHITGRRSVPERYDLWRMRKPRPRRRTARTHRHGGPSRHDQRRAPPAAVTDAALLTAPPLRCDLV
jgi:hypothetical protein